MLFKITAVFSFLLVAAVMFSTPKATAPPSPDTLVKAQQTSKAVAPWELPEHEQCVNRSGEDRLNCLAFNAQLKAAPDKDYFSGHGFAARAPDGRAWKDLDIVEIIDKLRPVMPRASTSELARMMTPDNPIGKEFAKFTYMNIYLYCSRDPNPTCPGRQLTAAQKVLENGETFLKTLFTGKGVGRYWDCNRRSTTPDRGINFEQANNCFNLTQ